MVTGGKQRTHFTILSKSPMRPPARFDVDESVIVAWNRIVVQPNRSPPTPNSDDKDLALDGGSQQLLAHRGVAHGAGLKIQLEFDEDPKLPQLRQQAANSS